MSTIDLQKAKDAYLLGNECYELDCVESDVDIEISERGADLDHSNTDLEMFRDKLIRVRLGISQ